MKPTAAELAKIRAERCRHFREGSKCEMQCAAGVRLGNELGRVVPCFGPTVAAIHERIGHKATLAKCQRYATQDRTSPTAEQPALL